MKVPFVCKDVKGPPFAAFRVLHLMLKWLIARSFGKKNVINVHTTFVHAGIIARRYGNVTLLVTVPPSVGDVMLIVGGVVQALSRWRNSS
jgi:membrane protein YqaA with SNARE-associated domain